jgi:8-oxo-dGTP diphosphatase
LHPPNRPSIVVAVIVHDGRTLLVRRRQTEDDLSWQFPAGEQEPGETPEQAAVREVAEEVGLTVTPVAVIGERNHPVTGRHLVYVACESDTAAARVLDTDELADLEWCDHEALTRRIPKGVFEPVRDYLPERLATTAAPTSVWIFHGDGCPYASGVFHSRADALAWVAKHGLTGIVARYEVGDGCYDLAVRQGRFTGSKPHHGSADHVARFSPGLGHIHVNAGRADAGSDI